MRIARPEDVATRERRPMMEDSAPTTANVTPQVTCAFYVISDSRFFLGTVALLNSLRLVGHGEPIFLVDAGLTPEQRHMIADHVTMIPAPEGSPATFLKMLGPLEFPAKVAILLDADVIVVRPLTELIQAARDGRLVAFVNNEPNHARFFPDWASALALGPLRRQPYFAAGQLLIPESLSRRLLHPWKEGQAKIDIRRTLLGGGTLSDPFYFLDMDVLNAVVAAQFEAEEIVLLEHRLAPVPPFPGLRLVDRESLFCHYPDGVRPFLLHHALAKPWLKATCTNIYSLLLPRLLLSPDVAIRLEPKQLPLRLREGWFAAADRRRANMQAFVYAEARAQLGRFGIRTRIAEWRRRRS
jgi:hypothetical protein